MDEPLYRPEVLAHRGERSFGSPLVSHAWPTRVLTGIIALALALLLLLFVCGGFSRRETLQGVVLPAGGLLEARSERPGLISEVRAREGQAVRADEVLFVLSGERYSARWQTRRRVDFTLAEQATQIVRELEQAQQRSQAKRDSAGARSERLSEQVAQLDAEIRLQLRRLALAKDADQRFAALAKEQVVGREQADQKTDDLLEQGSQLLFLQRSRSSVMAERDAVTAELRELPLQLAQDVAAIRQRLAQVERAVAENDGEWRWEVRAPRDGLVTMVMGEAGQFVAAGASLASVAPAGAPLEVVLYAASRAAGQVRTGMKVQLRFEALPFERFGQFEGRVRTLSRSPLTNHPLGGADAHAEPHYRVRVDLSQTAVKQLGSAGVLRPGMQTEATVLLEHRKFYEWAFKPLLGISRGAL